MASFHRVCPSVQADRVAVCRAPWHMQTGRHSCADRHGERVALGREAICSSVRLRLSRIVGQVLVAGELLEALRRRIAAAVAYIGIEAGRVPNGPSRAWFPCRRTRSESAPCHTQSLANGSIPLKLRGERASGQIIADHIGGHTRRPSPQAAPPSRRPPGLATSRGRIAKVSSLFLRTRPALVRQPAGWCITSRRFPPGKVLPVSIRSAPARQLRSRLTDGDRAGSLLNPAEEITTGTAGPGAAPSDHQRR
jgi:hypothetical protein